MGIYNITTAKAHILEQTSFKLLWGIDKGAATWDFQQCGMCDQHSLRSACAYTQSDQSLCWLLEYSMTVKLLTKLGLEFQSIKGGCISSSEPTLVKMPHCCKSHVAAQMLSMNETPKLLGVNWLSDVEISDKQENLYSHRGLTRDLSCWSPQKWRIKGFMTYSYFTFHIANNKGADQTARVCRLVCAFVVRKQQYHGFSCRSPYGVEAHASWPPPGYSPVPVRT